MADQPEDPSKSKDEAEKKQPETVLLTTEELRAISGGAALLPAFPKAKPGVAQKS